jgi:hypothetical protein
VSTTLKTLAETARLRGWAVGSGSISQIQAEAQSLGWTEVPTRRGDPAVTTLRPLSPSQARPNSLSSQYGMGAQPLHTDGAHLIRPPDVVVLTNEVTNSTPTRLWREGYGGLFLPEFTLHGIFLVSSGKNSFFTTTFSREGLRYDPGCMTPCDARARQTEAIFMEAADKAVDHEWSEPGMILVINNRRALHARASAVEEPARELQRVSFHVKGAAS